MPRAVRNFWIDAIIDGRQSTLSGGPRSKEDGMYIKIYQRDDGCVTTALDVRCYTDFDGNLVTNVYDTKGKSILSHITKR